MSNIKDLLDRLTPQQQAFAKATAQTNLQNKVLSKQLAEMKAQYDDLWKVVIVILDASPDKELRIHESQFLRFKEEYRIDKRLDNETKEVVLKLLTLLDGME